MENPQEPEYRCKKVYKGHDPVLNRYVAIKVIAETLDTDPDLVERFRREAKAAAQLNHPNIITIYDFIEDEGSLYIVMELLDGKDLKELIKGAAPLTVEQILGMMEQIADGLGFAHENEMVHRDLKPANIHVTKKRANQDSRFRPRSQRVVRDDQNGPCHGDAQLYVPRTSSRPQSRRPLRYLFARRGLLRASHEEKAL